MPQPVILLLIVLIHSVVLSAVFAGDSNGDLNAGAVSASPSISPTAGAFSTPADTPLTESQRKKLISDFKRVVANEERVFGQSERAAWKQFTVNQNLKQKTWREQEKKARHAFFDQHQNGPERRQFIQDYLQRKEKFEQSIKTDAVQMKVDWKNKREALKRDHQAREALIGVRHP